MCGCGNRLSYCMFWQDVLDRSFGVERPESLEYLQSIRSSLKRIHRLVGALRSAHSSGYARNGYLRKVLEVYRVIQDVSGAAWIVDSSKLPSFAYLLSLTKDINLSILHLVRDPRAVAFSWKRRAINGHRASIWKAPILWTLRNRAAYAFKRYSTVPYSLIRYEDFVSHPEPASGLPTSIPAERAANASTGRVRARVRAQGEVSTQGAPATAHLPR